MSFHYFDSLRVLCVSHNNINSLGDTPCPSCFSNTADYFYSKSNPSVVMSSPRMNQSNSSSLVLRAKTPERNKFKNSSHSEMLNLKRPISRGGSAYYSNSSSSVKLSGHTFSPPHIARKTTSKSTIFPQLEVLVLSHNGKIIVAIKYTDDQIKNNNLRCNRSEWLD